MLQAKLSKLVNITLHTITKIESEARFNPRLMTLKKIVDPLGVSINDLFKL
ncbi:MAG TPA: helix-turn-helix domain-containing protein [Bacteroidota bacterium]|nr:helix-turn-helix domain-containing protein [Bacteroidota bacterium]